jgi:hypothetical protein
MICYDKYKQTPTMSLPVPSRAGGRTPKIKCMRTGNSFYLSGPCDSIQILDADASSCMCGSGTVYNFLVSCFLGFEGYLRLGVWLAHLHVREARSESWQDYCDAEGSNVCLVINGLRCKLSAPSDSLLYTPRTCRTGDDDGVL